MSALRTEDYLEALEEEIKGEAVDVSIHVGHRTPEQELLGIADARPGSIIVLSTSGATGQAGILGSTTDRIVRTQSHPVLAVPAR